MFWTPTRQFHPSPFDTEAELETTIAEAKTALFGESRIYLDVKKLIWKRAKTQNIPDGIYLGPRSSLFESPAIVVNEFVAHFFRDIPRTRIYLTAE